jgi:O-antigen/teichoic acid export membrane protein
LRNNLHGLLSGSATYLLSNVLNAAIPFALMPILTRYLTAPEYGEVAMFQTLVAALSGVVGVSAAGAAARKYYDADLSQSELKFFIGACLQILAASAAACFLLLYLARDYVAAWTGLSSAWVLLAACTAAAGFVLQVRMGQWQVRKQAFSYGRVQVAQSAANVTLSLLLVVVFTLGSAGRIWAISATTLMFAVTAAALLRRDDLLGFSWRPDFVREALHFGVPLVPHVAGFLLLGLCDRFLINAELGLGQAGIYMVAFQLASCMGLLFDAINNAFVPWLFEHLMRDDRDEKRQVVKLTYLYFCVALGMAAIAFLLGPWAVRFIAGERYAAAGQVIGWLALAQAFGGMYLMVTNYIFYSKRTGLLSAVTLVCGALNLLLLLALIPAWGLVGAGVATALATGARFLLTWCVAQRRHPMPWFTSSVLAQ